MNINQMRKHFLLFIFSLLFFQLAFSQSRSIEEEEAYLKQLYLDSSHKELGIEALVYIHYESVIDENRPSNSLFYSNEMGDFAVESSHSWEGKSSKEIILSQLDYSDCKLVEELKFTHLDAEWIKQQLRLNAKNDKAIVIHYNAVDRIGYFRTYRLVPEKVD